MLDKENFIIQPGMILVEGIDHIITVHRVYDNYYIEYFENGYLQETKMYYITGLIEEQNTTGDIKNHIKYFKDNRELPYNDKKEYLKQVLSQLNDDEWQNIKSFEDALKYIPDRDLVDIIHTVNNLVYSLPFGRHLAAIWKLDVITSALNRNYSYDISDIVYYPFIMWGTPEQIQTELKYHKDLTSGPMFRMNGEEYQLVIGDYTRIPTTLYNQNIISDLSPCRSAEIAKHMSKYFSKEIFDAYNIHNKAYEWI